MGAEKTDSNVLYIKTTLLAIGARFEAMIGNEREEP